MGDPCGNGRSTPGVPGRRWMVWLVGMFVVTATVAGTAAALPVTDRSIGVDDPSSAVTVGTDVDPDDADATLDGSGGPYYLGMDLLVTDASAREPLDLVLVTEDGREQFQGVVLADGDGEAMLETRGLDAGTYRIRDSEGTLVAEFRLVEQRVRTFEFERDSVTLEANASTRLAVESNRREYVHYVSAWRNGSRLDADTLSSILEDAGEPADVDGDGLEETLVVDGGATQSLSVDFDGHQVGNYTVVTRVADATAGGRAEIVVERPDPGDAPAVEDYETANGDVTTDGLGRAITDWAAGEISTDLLQDVIRAWAAS